MLLLLLKGKQIQAGADWDSVIGISVAIIMAASIALIVALIISRVLQTRRFRRAQLRTRRRHSR